MSIIRITKEFRFEGAHALHNYDGKCRHIHGHSYILYVTVKGSPANNEALPKDGMIMDFTDLKSIVNKNIIDKFDHALLLRNTSKLIEEISQEYENIIVVDFQPTCENLISYFANVIKANLPKKVELFKLKLYETATSYVEWYAEDNKEENKEGINE
ncbi:MAG: 6-carboxytetrahydropterin synthase [Bacteroidales bacterium]